MINPSVFVCPTIILSLGIGGKLEVVVPAS